MRRFEGCERKRVELAAISLALANQRPDRGMGVAKGCSLLYQVISQIGCHHAARDRGPHPLDVEARLLKSTRKRRQNEKGCVDSVEQHSLIVLQILVVSARQSLQCRKQRREI